MSGSKILVSGCGITYSRQKKQTWVNVLKLAGCDILDVGGPAVSNQWILNKFFLACQTDPDIKIGVIQLSGLGKLDVEVDVDRIKKMVLPDPLRPFIIDANHEVKSFDQIDCKGIWPSSSSLHHVSKRLWRKWLFSPMLEKEDLYCKLGLLQNFCQQKDIQLHVYQGYQIDWNDQQASDLKNIIKNIDCDFYSQYLKSAHYCHHDSAGNNTVPCLGYQIELAETIAKELTPAVQIKISKFKDAYDKSRSSK